MKKRPFTPRRLPWLKKLGLGMASVALIALGGFYFMRLSSTSPQSDLVGLHPQRANDVVKASVSTKPEVAEATAARGPEQTEQRSTRSPDAVAWLEGLAKQNPTQAISWALTENDSERRAELVQAALRGWASVDADAAANWARHQSYADEGQAMSAVFNGANQAPEKAVQLANRLVHEDPAHAADYASYLVFALGTVGEFSRAAGYAAETSGELQTQLLTSAYSRWARQDPEPAVRAALKLEDPSQQRAAFQAALSGWAQSDPEQLTKLAVSFPEGDDRKLALTTGLRGWIEKNPEAAAEWISHHKFMPEMEAALEN